MTPETSDPESMLRLSVERVTTLNTDDLQAICEAADHAIIDGGGFGWIACVRDTEGNHVALHEH